MLRTNTKKVIDGMIAHVGEFYGVSGDLCGDLEAVACGGVPVYRRGVMLAEGGCFLVYFDQVRTFLRDLLEETEAEAGRYSDNDCWRLYCHLIGRACEKIKKNQKEAK